MLTLTLRSMKPPNLDEPIVPLNKVKCNLKRLTSTTRDTQSIYEKSHISCLKINEQLRDFTLRHEFYVELR